MAKLSANSGDPDQTPRSAASDLGLHCLPITLLRVSRLQWVTGWGLDTSGRVFTITGKGDDFCDFPFAFLDTNPLLKIEHVGTYAFLLV